MILAEPDRLAVIIEAKDKAWAEFHFYRGAEEECRYWLKQKAEGAGEPAPDASPGGEQ